MALLNTYPIMADLYTRAMGAPPMLGRTCGLEALRYKDLQTDHYLRQATAVIQEYIRKFSRKVPHHVQVPSVMIQVEITIVKYFLPAEDLQAQDDSFESVPTDVEGISQTDPLPIANVADALLILNFAELHSTRLIEVLATNDDESSFQQCTKKWKELKDYLTKFSSLIDQILQHYRQSTGKLPEVKSLQEQKQKILKILQPVAFSKVHKQLGEMLQFSADELFVSALGLNRDVANYLSSMDSDIRCHETDFYHLRDAVCKSIDFHFNQNPTENSSDVLMKSGFTFARAEFLSDHIKSIDPNEHQSLSYWVEAYLDYMFKYDIFLAGSGTEFPHDPESMNDWIMVPTERSMENEDADDSDAEDDDTVKILYVPVIKTTADKVHLLTKDGTKFPPAEIKLGFWYHGTDFDSAESIRANGVHISKGHVKQDFSDGRGFYVTPYFDFAVKWAEKKGNNAKCAVVVFDHMIDSDGYKGLDLTLAADEKWRNVVKYYRSGSQSCFKCPRKLHKELNAAAFIEGPMSGDGTRYTNANWQPSKKIGDESVQLCIKSQKLADEFSMKIVGIIFFCHCQRSEALVSCSSFTAFFLSTYFTPCVGQYISYLYTYIYKCINVYYNIYKCIHIIQYNIYNTIFINVYI